MNGSEFVVGLLAASVRISTPYLLGTLGEMFAERSGVLNLGIEGMMFFGALAAFLGTYFTGSLAVGVVAGILAGVLLGLLLGVTTITLGLSQHVVGLGIFAFASGLGMYIYRLSIGTPAVPPAVQAFRPLAIPILSGIPFIGPIFFQQYAITYVAFMLVPLCSFVLYRTGFGLGLRAVGERPGAADTVGISVARTRYIALVIASGFAGLAGAFLSIVQLNTFVPDIIHGRGWICIALVVFGYWQPTRIMWGALLFGLLDACQLRLQGFGWNVPYQYFMMLPYVLTIAILALFQKKARAPGALLIPYRRE
jgi:ABC-type uncharacterized transport system permease subunit